MRLIDADVAKEWFKGGRVYMFADDVLNRIDHTPTIDAVHVVRCEDCKFFDIKERDVGVCVIHSAPLPNVKVAMARKDFCSYGLRKDGDGG